MVGKKSSTKIHLFKKDMEHKSEKVASEFKVDGLWYWLLLSVIKSAYEDSIQESFHSVSFHLFHQTNANADITPQAQTQLDSETHRQDSVNLETTAPNFSHGQILLDIECVYSKIYTYDAIFEEDAKIHILPYNPSNSNDVEYVAAPLILYLDSTWLANFRPASL